MTLALAVLLAVTLAAAATDVRKRRIPNALTGGAAVTALALAAPNGVVALLVCVATMCTAFAVGSLAFSAGWFGGGDVKLIAASCGLAGFPGAVSLVLEILVCGAFLALVTAALSGRLGALVRSTAGVATRGAATERTLLPYGVAIAAGSIVYAFSALVPALRLTP
jgi:prepilin peptidase CpaA